MTFDRKESGEAKRIDITAGFKKHINRLRISIRYADIIPCIKRSHILSDSEMTFTILM